MFQLDHVSPGDLFQSFLQWHTWTRTWEMYIAFLSLRDHQHHLEQ